MQILIRFVVYSQPPLPRSALSPTVSSMTRLCILVVSALTGYAAWWLADAAELGFFASFLISGAGSVVGVWLGWKLAQKLE